MRRFIEGVLGFIIFMAIIIVLLVLIPSLILLVAIMAAIAAVAITSITFLFNNPLARLLRKKAAKKQQKPGVIDVKYRVK